jgi:hypothetical protein
VNGRFTRWPLAAREPAGSTAAPRVGSSEFGNPPPARPADSPGSVCRIGGLIAGEQRGRRRPQGPGDPPQAEQRHVPLAPLDAADDRAVQPAPLGQPGLGQPGRLPQLADAVADTLEESPLVPVPGG